MTSFADTNSGNQILQHFDQPSHRALSRRPAKHGRSGCTWPQANHNAVYLESASAAKKAVKKVGNSRKRVEKRLKRRYAV
jgi:hypothetical protein